MLDVYLDPCTVNSRKVLAGLDLLGTDYKFHHVDYFSGEHKGDAYKKINPHATVPSATDGDLTITESNAILQYAADISGEKGAALYPKDLKKRTDVNRWLLWEGSVWFQSCYVYLIEFVVKPLLKSEPDQSVIDAQAPRWNQLAGILDAQLGKTKYITDNDLSIADLAIAAPMHLHAAQRLPLDQHPNLARWIKDIEALPSWQKTQGAVDKALLPSKHAPASSSMNGAAATTNGHTTSSDLPSSVTSTLNYTKASDSHLTELYFYDHPSASSIHEPGDDPHPVTIHNGWPHASSFHLDTHGFSLHPLNTPARDTSFWENESLVRSDFYPEIVSFLKSTTGASRVLVFDHTIRTKANTAKKLTQETNTSQRAPVRLVHCDYTAESGPVRVQQLLPDEAPHLLSKRVAFYNVWKPLSKVEEMPLAMCDVATSPQDDFFKLFLRYRDRTGENYVMKHSDAHKWWYFPEMDESRVIVLKTYESDGSRARFVGHSAFEDPSSKEGAPFRESVEIRTIAFFD